MPRKILPVCFIISLILTAFINVSCVSTGPAASTGKTCDRECLEGFITKYIDALEAQKGRARRLPEGVRAVGPRKAPADDHNPLRPHGRASALVFRCRDRSSRRRRHDRDEEDDYDNDQRQRTTNLDQTCSGDEETWCTRTRSTSRRGGTATCRI